MADPVSVYLITADETSASNGITFGIYVHSVVLNGQAANQVTLALYDAASVTGNPKIRIATDVTGDTEFNHSKQYNFSPPIPFGQLTADIGGTNAEAFVYYNRQ